MLVLSRHKNEKIIVMAGDAEIVITVVLIKGTQVRIGIDAPTDVQIMRAELIEGDKR